MFCQGIHVFSRMRSEGFPFIVWGSGGWTLVRLESRRVIVGSSSAIPCLWGKLQNLSFLKVSTQVLRGRRGTLWHSNLFDNVSSVSKLEDVSHEMLVLLRPRVSSWVSGFLDTSLCLWGKLQNISFWGFPRRLSCRFAWQAWHFVTFQPVWSCAESVKIGRSLARNDRFAAPTFLVSSLWFSRHVAVFIGEAAKPLLLESFQAGCHVVSRGRRGTLWQSNLFDNVLRVSKLEDVSHEMLVLLRPRVSSRVSGFLDTSPCLWGKLQNLSFSKVSKQVVMSFCVASVALWHSNLFYTASKFLLCGWRNNALHTSTLHFTLHTLHSTLSTLHFPLYTLHVTLYTLYSTFYTLHSTLCTPQPTVHTPRFLQSTLQTLHSTLCTPHFTLHTPHSTLYTLHSTLYTLHCTLLTPHFALHTPHSTLHTPHSTLHTPHSTLYTLHSTLHTLHFKLYTLHSTLHTLHFPLHTPNSTLYTPHSTLYTLLHTLHLTLHSALYTLHSTLQTLHFTFCTLHSTLCTPHFTLYIPRFPLYTPHSTLYTLHSSLHTLHSSTHSPHSTLLTIHTPNSALHTLHSTLYTPHSTLYTLHSALYTLHSTLHTLHFKHSTRPTPHFTLHTLHSTHSTPHPTLSTPHRGLVTGEICTRQFK